MPVADEVAESLQNYNALLVSLLPDQLIKEHVAPIPEYLLHRVLRVRVGHLVLGQVLLVMILLLLLGLSFLITFAVILLAPSFWIARFFHFLLLVAVERSWLLLGSRLVLSRRYSAAVSGLSSIVRLALSLLVLLTVLQELDSISLTELSYY